MSGLYDYRWQQFRLRFLAANPLCKFCQERAMVTAATVVDHIEPHRGDPAVFWRPGNHQALCKPCHDGDKQRIERGETPKATVGYDGWPLSD